MVYTRHQHRQDKSSMAPIPGQSDKYKSQAPPLSSLSSSRSLSGVSKSAFKIREMLEAVRHRVASVEPDQYYTQQRHMNDILAPKFPGQRNNSEMIDSDDTEGLFHSNGQLNDSLDLSGSSAFSSRRSSMRSNSSSDSVVSSIMVCIQSIKLDLNTLMDNVVELKREFDREAENNFGQKTNHTHLLDLFRNIYDIKNNVEFMKLKTASNLDQTRRKLVHNSCDIPDAFNHDDCFHNNNNSSNNNYNHSRLSLASDKSRSPHRLGALRKDVSNCSLRRSNTMNPKLMRVRQGRHSIGGPQVTSHNDDLYEGLIKVPEESHTGRFSMTSTNSS